MASVDPPSPLDEFWQSEGSCPPGNGKPRSHSLDIEGVKFIQSKFASLMNRRKDRRRDSPNLDRGSLSPSRSSISKRLLSVIGDGGNRRSSLEVEIPRCQLNQLYPEPPRRSSPIGLPIPSKPMRRYLGGASPSSPCSSLPQKRILPTPPSSNYRSQIDDHREGIFTLPPGTRRRNLSAGPDSAQPYGGYGDYLKANFASDYGSGSPRECFISLTTPEDDSETDSDESDYDEDGEEADDEEYQDDKYEKGQLVRRHSMEPERKRNGSGHTYFRGEDPDQATIVFRDCRGLPVTAPFLENVRRSDLEENESQIMVKFFKYHTTYDLIPTSAKLVVFDTKLQVKKAFYALVYNGVRAAPLWDSGRQRFVGMLTITDFIRILQSFYNCPNRKMDELEEHRLELWRTLLHDDVRELISIKPIETLYEAIRSLIHHKIHRLPVIDPDTGSVLYIITHKRILKFLYLYINELPKPSIMLKSLRELNIGTYDNIETARGDTLIIEALNKFVERRISALPIVDDEGRLVDIYAKFDVINLAAEGTYHNLDVTLQQANEYRNEWFEGVLKCTLDETLEMVMERIVRAEVHRLVIVDESNKVIGIISLSDILNELVLKPCHDDPLSLKGRPVSDIVAGIKSSPGNSARSRESLKRDSSSSNKTGSEESVEVTCWGNMSDAKSDERRTSIPETIDGRQYDRPMDRTQHEILPISS